MNYIYVAQSLDGYIAGPNGELEWLSEVDNPQQSDFGFAHFISSIDALVMGRNTFEKVMSFEQWPYTKPVFVVSNRPFHLPQSLEGRVEFIRGEPDQLVKQLNHL
ncbi:dihydrofolate reductase family protein, partial [Vibrio sp.]|uniref:dihydrofolate reductase family protein n=1 Tax=Vibrio sp. TaxID=678 RepID=UPI003D13257E